LDSTSTKKLSQSSPRTLGSKHLALYGSGK
jgi:hypothetical protein